MRKQILRGLELALICVPIFGFPALLGVKSLHSAYHGVDYDGMETSNSQKIATGIMGAACLIIDAGAGYIALAKYL